MARSARQFSRSGARRRRLWARTTWASAEITTTAAQEVDLGASFRVAGGDLAGATVGPIFCEMFSVVNTAAAAGFCPVGVAIGSDPITVADFNPGGDPYLDWMLFDAIKVGAGAGDVERRLGADRLHSGSMRRMEELQQRPWMVAGPVRTGGSTCNVEAEVSMLVILP